MKRPVTKESLLKAIDSAHRKIAKTKADVQSLLDEEQLYSGTENASELRTIRDKIEKGFRKIKRLETVRLKKLGEKLAEVQTLQLV
jgi:hypothetical protein